MISVEVAVALVIHLVIVGVIFGLLFFLLRFVAGKWAMAKPFTDVGEVILIILAVLVLIGILLNLAGHPVFRP
jgi:hypothetical protein